LLEPALLSGSSRGIRLELERALWKEGEQRLLSLREQRLALGFGAGGAELVEQRPGGLEEPGVFCVDSAGQGAELGAELAIAAGAGAAACLTERGRDARALGRLRGD